MRTTVALLALCLLALPLASGHIVYARRDPLTGQCVGGSIGTPGSPPHGALSNPPCLAVHPSEAAAGALRAASLDLATCYGVTDNGQPVHAVCRDGRDCTVVFLFGAVFAFIGCT